MTKINLILLGRCAVGKTCLLRRFQDGKFDGSCPASTGMNFYVKNIYVEGKEITMFMWDTPGHEKFNAVVRSFYNQGVGVLLVYDVRDPSSIETISKWMSTLKDMEERTEILIAGNKNEDPTQRTVAVSMAKKWAKQENLEHMEVSALSGENVVEAFTYLAKKVLIAKGIIKEDPGSLTFKAPSADSTSQTNKSDENDGTINLEEEPVAKKRACC